MTEILVLRVGLYLIAAFAVFSALVLAAVGLDTNEGKWRTSWFMLALAVVAALAAAVAVLSAGDLR